MIKTLKDVRLKGKHVLVRASLNVPMRHGEVQDDFRLQESIPTIRYTVEQEGACIVVSHLGRPEPVFDEGREIPAADSLQPIVKRLEKLLGKAVPFFQEPLGDQLNKHLAGLKPGDVAVLENLRFYKGEKENAREFALALASIAEIYVNDSFDACHRAHASIAGVPSLLPSAAGLLLEKEVSMLEEIRERPKKPMVVVVGGAKVETKAAFLAHISKNADAILLGNLISKEAKEKGLEVAENAEVVYAQDGVDGGFDLGPKAIKAFVEKINRARTVFWAGPLGLVEKEQYENGSLAIAKAILESGAFAVAGGGDLAAFLGKHGLRKRFSHVSTGGGAMLAFLAGEELPGLKALEHRV